MNILILGWYYSSNLGDAVICECVAELLRRHHPDAVIRIADLAGRVSFPERTRADLSFEDRLVKRQKLRTAATRLGWDKQLCHEQWCFRQHEADLDAVTEGPWDLAVFAGGQLFMDDLALYVCYHTRRLAERGIPVIFNACGIGSLISPGVRRQLAEALQLPNVRLVSCRDGADTVNRICGREIAVPTADAALWAGDCCGMTPQPRNAVGLGVLYPQSLDPGKTAAFWNSMTEELDRRGIPWVFFTNGKEKDMEFARTLRHEPEQLLPAPETPEELVRLLASFPAIIGFRLHSHIIAASMGIPTVGLVWDQKVPGFFRNMGIYDQCFTIRDSAGKVADALERARTADPEFLYQTRQKALELLLRTADSV